MFAIYIDEYVPNITPKIIAKEKPFKIQKKERPGTSRRLFFRIIIKSRGGGENLIPSWVSPSVDVVPGVVPMVPRWFRKM